MKWGTCHMINVVYGTKPCKLSSSERRCIVRDYSILDPMSGINILWCRSSIVDSDETVGVIATLTHSEKAFTKYILDSTKKGASIVIFNLDQGDLGYSQGCRSVLTGKTGM